MKTIFIVQYFDKYNNIVIQSDELDSYQEAEDLQQEGKPGEFTTVSYSKIDKRVKYDD